MGTFPHKRPDSRSHEIDYMYFQRPLHGLHYYLYSCPGVEKKIFKKIRQFYTFYPKIKSLWDGEGRWSWNLLYSLSFPFPTGVHTRFCKDLSMEHFLKRC